LSHLALQRCLFAVKQAQRRLAEGILSADKAPR
jgi:hypothetical protein